MHTATMNRITLSVSNALVSTVHFVLAVGFALFVAAMAVLTGAGQFATAGVFGDGPSPAAQNSANMPQARLTIHYNRVFMQWLYMFLNKMLLCTQQTLPEKSGQTFRNFMAVPLGPDTQQAFEGAIGNPETIQYNFRDIVVGQWGNYNNISDFAFLTSISNDLEENRKIMAYQLGVTIDDLVMYMFDYLRTYDTRTTNQDSLNAPYPFTKNIIEQMPQSLLGATVLPMDSGSYNGSIHPFFVGDLMLDDSNNSVVDVWKHTDAGQLKLEALTTDNEGQASTRVLELFGCRWRQSTNQTQYANWQSSGLTGISTYCAGRDAVIFVNFPNSRHTKIDPKWQNLNLWAGEYTQRTAYDPNRMIAAGTGYNAVLGVGLPPDPNGTSRARIAVAVPQTT